MKATSTSSFKWTTRIIGFIWIFLTGCFAILNIYVFVQPQWIGDTLLSSRAGHFGLYSYCVSTVTDLDFYCHGTWTDFGTILNAPFRAATFFVGFSALLILICLGLFVFFLCLPTRLVYFICAFIQITCSMCFLIALIVYPSGFDNETIRAVCGPNVNDFYLGSCQMRWGYILAIIAFFIILSLAVLACFLGVKQARDERMRETINVNRMAPQYGELNDAFDDRTYSEQLRANYLR